MAVGAVNAYACRACGGVVFTVHRDEGVTPMFVRCLALAGCSGLMQSALYRCFQRAFLPSWEWYRPAGDALHQADAADRQVVVEPHRPVRVPDVEGLADLPVVHALLGVDDRPRLEIFQLLHGAPL